MGKYVVYMVRCSDGSLYTGITNDIKGRILRHNSGKAAKYTRSRLPVNLVYVEPAQDKSTALKKEIAIKKLPKLVKESLINTMENRLNLETYRGC